MAWSCSSPCSPAPVLTGTGPPAGWGGPGALGVPAGPPRPRGVISGRGSNAEAGSLFADLSSLAANIHGPRTEGVTLSTLHKAKGLEWDVVFLVGMTEGAMPSAYASTTAELAEEERLLHVGVTRARNELHLTWATSNPRGWPNRPSPFLDRVATPTARPARRQARQRPSLVPAGPTPTLSCPLCTEPLKGIAARHVGLCAHCVLSAPGEVGKLAREIRDVVDDAANELGVSVDKLVSPNAMLRLLDQRPATAGGVATTTGVGLRGPWAEAAAKILRN